MIVGNYYRVSAVLAINWHGYRYIWLPVIGPKHEDAELINFPWQHYHLDWRFVSHRVFDWIASVRGPSFVYASPIQCPDAHGNKGIAEGPVLKRMKCKRELPPFPTKAVENRWLPKLSAKYACAKLVNGACPHRGIPVEAMIRDGDILTCPGHGLRWNAVTGLPHVSTTPGTTP
jgi:hypothetical protein